MVKTKYLFKIYYIGSKFHGSQRQSKVMTVEDYIIYELQKKGYIIELKNSEFEFASRTDRYVSARGAYFTCITQKKPILMDINSGLPKEIGVWAYNEVPLEFSARKNAILRHYIYIYPKPISFLEKTSHLNLTIVEKACKLLEGKHDFRNFSKKENNIIKTVRDMESVMLSTYDDHLIFEFKSKSFLRQQIRRTVKKLMELGTNEISYDDFLELFDPTKNISYQPADPYGLILWDIKYDKKVGLIEDLKSKERMHNYFMKKQLHFRLKYQLFRILQQNNFC
ncbi:MAG: hypothetical protein ACFE9Z_10925 [Promethearchaeota archaeon]